MWKDLLDENIHKYQHASVKSGVLDKVFYCWNDECVDCDGIKPKCGGYLTQAMLKECHIIEDD
jgi:hypothetical protein